MCDGVAVCVCMTNVCLCDSKHTVQPKALNFNTLFNEAPYQKYLALEPSQE